MSKASKSNIIKSSELDVSKVKYSDLKTLDNGAKVVYINYNTDNNPILLQTPELICLSTQDGSQIVVRIVENFL